MATRETVIRDSEEVPKDEIWAWHPPLPLTGVPVFVWPPRILEGLKYLVSRAFLGSLVIPFGALAAITWYLLQPALERCVVLEAGWILQLFARNLMLMLIVAGGLHLYFYVFSSSRARNESSTRTICSGITPDFLLTARSGTTCSGPWQAG